MMTEQQKNVYGFIYAITLRVYDMFTMSRYNCECVEKFLTIVARGLASLPHVGAYMGKRHKEMREYRKVQGRTIERKGCIIQ